MPLPLDEASALSLEPLESADSSASSADSPSPSLSGKVPKLA